jgi:hypothetical protein
MISASRFADPDREAPRPHAGPRAVRPHASAAADLKRVTSGGSRSGNALPSVVADPWFEGDSAIIRLG